LIDPEGTGILRRLNDSSFRTAAWRSPAVMTSRKSDKRRQILDAAIVVFAATGFHKSRVSDIAREAGVADGTIYLYFKSKDDVLISIFEEAMGEMIERAEAAIKDLDDPLDRIVRFAMHHMENVEQNLTLAKVLQVELRLSNTFMKEYHPKRLREYMDIIGRAIDEGRERGLVRADVDSRIVRRALFGALDEIAMQWILTSNPTYSLTTSAATVADVFVRGIRV
jgi:TetR/AcrR family fatty acid metabolism transcriptional regulator